jgi:hypothetical protein
MSETKPLPIEPNVLKALRAAPMPNLHKLYQEYLSSDFRREWMKEWAGDDPEKQRLVAEMLAQTTPM